MQGLSGEPPTVIPLLSGHRLSFSQVIRFQSCFHFPSLPSTSLNVFTHVHLFVAHRYLPLAVVPIFVPVPYDRILY